VGTAVEPVEEGRLVRKDGRRARLSTDSWNGLNGLAGAEASRVGRDAIPPLLAGLPVAVPAASPSRLRRSISSRHGISRLTSSESATTGSAAVSWCSPRVAWRSGACRNDPPAVSFPVTIPLSTPTACATLPVHRNRA
jgi:hypothetical protein